MISRAMFWTGANYVTFAVDESGLVVSSRSGPDMPWNEHRLSFRETMKLLRVILTGIESYGIKGSDCNMEGTGREAPAERQRQE